MPLLALGMIRAIWALRREPQFVSLGLLTVIAIASGTGFYTLVEGLRVVDALYFSVVTLTTVGYGDFAPETDAGKLFTAVYVLVGIGILLTFVTTIAGKMAQTSPLHPFAGQPARNGGDSSPDGGSRRPSPGPSQAASAGTVTASAPRSASRSAPTISSTTRRARMRVRFVTKA